MVYSAALANAQGSLSQKRIKQRPCCRKEDGSYERPGRLLLFTPAPHHPLRPNHDPIKREPAIQRDRTILRFRQRPHQPLATVVVLRLGLVRDHPSGSGGDALIMAAHYWYSALPTSKLRIPIQVGWGRKYWGVLFEGASGCCWGGEFG